jgi:hypothetical protein
MPITPAFTVAATSTLGSVLLTDTSTGSDVGLDSRNVTFYKTDGSIFLSTTWDIGDTTKTIALLEKDYALNVKVDWLTAAVVSYTTSKLFGSNAFMLTELSTLTRLQTSMPTQMNDRDFYFYKIVLGVEIAGVTHAIDLMEDQYAAQGCIDRGQFLITNKNLFY